jgi:hypothetical protein
MNVTLLAVTSHPFLEKILQVISFYRYHFIKRKGERSPRLQNEPVKCWVSLNEYWSATIFVLSQLQEHLKDISCGLVAQGRDFHAIYA